MCKTVDFVVKTWYNKLSKNITPQIHEAPCFALQNIRQFSKFSVNNKIDQDLNNHSLQIGGLNPLFAFSKLTRPSTFGGAFLFCKYKVTLT